MNISSIVYQVLLDHYRSVLSDIHGCVVSIRSADRQAGGLFHDESLGMDPLCDGLIRYTAELHRDVVTSLSFSFSSSASGSYAPSIPLVPEFLYHSASPEGKALVTAGGYSSWSPLTAAPAAVVPASLDLFAHILTKRTLHSDDSALVATVDRVHSLLKR
ncbi:TPA: hypothetical protein HA265_05210 [Candidatus Woesearchaeota archaeon]|nr:hypothetical protein [Candidatus Woesearchaeota archaeon]